MEEEEKKKERGNAWILKWSEEVHSHHATWDLKLRATLPRGEGEKGRKVGA